MNKNLILLIIGSIVAAYFAGRYSAPERIKISSDSMSIIKDNENLKKELAQLKEKASQSDKVLVTVKTKWPDGKITTRSKLESKRESSEKTQSLSQSILLESKDSHTTMHTQKEVENRRGVVIGPLVGLHSGTAGILYGLHANKSILGPIHVGADLIVGQTFGLAGLLFAGFEL